MFEELPLLREEFLKGLERAVSGRPNWDEETTQYYARMLKMKTLGYAGFMYLIHEEDEALRLGDKETSDEMEALLDEISSTEQEWDFRPGEMLAAVQQICTHWQDGPMRGVRAMLSPFGSPQSLKPE